jgi:hypothetical protein
MNEAALTKRRQGLLVLGIVIFLFVFMLVISDFLIYIFEYRVNPQITSLNDAFRAVGSIYSLFGERAINPLSIGGQITALATLIISILMLVVFAAQLVAIVTAGRIKKDFRRLEKDLDREEDDLLGELEVTENLEAEILSKQDKILSHEESILSKLDKIHADKENKKGTE